MINKHYHFVCLFKMTDDRNGFKAIPFINLSGNKQKYQPAQIFAILNKRYLVVFIVNNHNELH